MMKSIRKVALLAGIALLSCQVAVADDIKVGVVDVHTVLKQLPQTKKIDADLQNEFKPRQQKIQEQQKSLQAAAEKLNRERTVMSDSEREKLSQKIEADRTNLMRLQQAFQEDLANSQRQAMEKLLNEVQESIGLIAKKEGYDVVLQKESLPYFTNKMDITDKVIKNVKPKR